jgi:hypothetical protein
MKFFFALFLIFKHRVYFVACDQWKKGGGGFGVVPFCPLFSVSINNWLTLPLSLASQTCFYYLPLSMVFYFVSLIIWA